MKAKFVFEKFTEDSDPIKDMGIGSVDILREARKLLSKGKKMFPNDFAKRWHFVFNYLRKFEGKMVMGIFKKYEETKEYRFKVNAIITYKSIEYMIIKDENDDAHRVIEGERYVFY